VSEANDRQVDGSHYKTPGLQHWDLAALFNWDYFQARMIAYMMRWRDKKGTVDLEKGLHFAQKYLELVRAGVISSDPRVVAPREQWLALLGAVEPMLNAVLPAVAARRGYMLVPIGSVLAYKAFTFEGSKDEKDWYRCKHCHEHFHVVTDYPPTEHKCSTAEPGRAYVDQG
jgi:hypothetical protein